MKLLLDEDSQGRVFVRLLRAAQAIDRERGWINEDGQDIGFAETIACEHWRDRDQTAR